jgi:hypothetical protein
MWNKLLFIFVYAITSTKHVLQIAISASIEGRDDNKAECGHATTDLLGSSFLV